MTGDFFIQQTKKIDGQIGVIFSNSTAYNVSFSWGTWNDLDRRTPRPVELDQLRVNPNETLPVRGLACARDLAIGTEEFVDWVWLSDEPDADGFELELVNATVSFSDADGGTPAADLPTVGTAAGLHLRVGLDYSCDDQILVTFLEDPDAAGGFRMDYTVIRDVNRELDRDAP